jgi:CheY-like chemotaxis protein
LAAPARKTVLIVEDDLELRSLFVITLKAGGFDAREASDGVDALRMIEIAVPDLVVLDLGLPTLDGLSVHDEIVAHAETRDLPIVVVTGSQQDLRERLEAACVLRKPVMLDHLLHTVRQCLLRAC